MKKLFLLLTMLLVASVPLAGVIVDASEHVVVTRFGRPTAAYSDPGLRLKWPWPIEQRISLDKRTLFLATDPAEFLTADKKNVVVEAFLTWRIHDPLRYLATLRTREAAEARLAALITSALGSAVGEQPFSAFVSPTGLAYTHKSVGSAKLGADIGRLESALLTATQQVAERDFGIAIAHIGVTRFVFPEQNLASVYDRMRAERERIAKTYRAEGEVEAQRIIAEAHLQSARITAAAEADAARFKGEGEAEAARIYARAYQNHEDLFAFLRTLEAYETILDQNTTILLPGDSPLFDLLLRFRPEEPIPTRSPGE